MSDDGKVAAAAARRSTNAVNEVSRQIELELVHFKSGAQDIEFTLDVTAETVWSNQQQMAELFDRDRTTIVEHIRNIFKDKELDEDSVSRKFPLTAADGKTYGPMKP